MESNANNGQVVACTTVKGAVANHIFAYFVIVPRGCIEKEFDHFEVNLYGQTTDL